MPRKQSGLGVRLVRTDGGTGLRGRDGISCEDNNNNNYKEKVVTCIWSGAKVIHIYGILAGGNRTLASIRTQPPAALSGVLTSTASLRRNVKLPKYRIHEKTT